jgi:MoxR-like ATPase
MIRTVKVTEEFLDRLDMLMPAHNSADGTPTAQDFLVHELPAVIELLKRDYEEHTYVRDETSGMRLITFESVLAGLITLHTALSDDGIVKIHWPTIHILPEA